MPSSFKKLGDYLDSLRLYDIDQFEGSMENITPIWINQTLSEGQGIKKAFGKRYEAVFTINDFVGSSDTLFFGLLTWLRSNDHDFESLGHPNCSIDVNKENMADIEIVVNFYDEVLVKVDPNGNLVHEGERFTIIEKYEPWVAEEFEITHKGNC